MSKNNDIRRQSRKVRCLIAKLFDDRYTDDAHWSKKQLLDALDDYEYCGVLLSAGYQQSAINATYAYISRIAYDDDVELALYSVYRAVPGADRSKGNAYRRRVLACYDDDFLVGLFPTDEDALDFVDEIQRGADEKAQKILGADHFLRGIVSYREHVYRNYLDKPINA